MADLKEAIDIARQAVDATPKNHPNRAALLNNLGRQLGNRYGRTGAMADLEASYRCFVEALAQNETPTSVRVQAGGRALSSTWAPKDSSNIIKHAKTAIELLPQLAARFLPNTDKQHLILQAAGLASNAAALALMMGQSPGKAVSWLEVGRGILAGSIQDLRTDLAILHERHPGLAASFENSRAILDGTVNNEGVLEPLQDLTFIRMFRNGTSAFVVLAFQKWILESDTKYTFTKAFRSNQDGVLSLLSDFREKLAILAAETYSNYIPSFCSISMRIQTHYQVLRYDRFKQQESHYNQSEGPYSNDPEHLT